MAETSRVKLEITFNDPDLDDEELEDEAQRLFAQMRDMDEIETINRVSDPDPPEQSKSLGGFLVGMLQAEVPLGSAKAFLGFLSERLSGKTIELKVEANGRKLSVKASSQAELRAAIAAAQEFVAG